MIQVVEMWKNLLDKTQVRGYHLHALDDSNLTFALVYIIIHCMNNFYSQSEPYYTRWLTEILRDAVTNSSILVLTGARQVGKTTLLRMEQPFAGYKYYTLDDYQTLSQAMVDPESLWLDSKQIIIDEVQRLPGLLLPVKKAVDQDPNRSFVLSGSANLLLMHHVSESLAGRALYFELLPLTQGEINGKKPSSLLIDLLHGKSPKDPEEMVEMPDLPPLLLRGFMPALLTMESAKSWTRWWEGYTATYLERDLRQISQIDSLLDFRRLMELLALRTGEILNQSDLARDAALSQPTAHRYINLLETSSLFSKLPPFTANRSLHLVKSPKAFCRDTGLVYFLDGIFREEELVNSNEFGHIFEAFTCHHLSALAQMMTPRARLYFWRMRSGQEVDFVLQHGRSLLPIEVKLTKDPTFGDTQGIRSFLGNHKDASFGLIVSRCPEIRRLGSQVFAVPWAWLTG